MKNEEMLASSFFILHSSFPDSFAARHGLIGLKGRLGHPRPDDDVAAELRAGRDARAPPDQRQAGVEPLRRGLVRRVILAVADKRSRADERLFVQDTAVDNRAGLD